MPKRRSSSRATSTKSNATSEGTGRTRKKIEARSAAATRGRATRAAGTASPRTRTAATAARAASSTKAPARRKPRPAAAPRHARAQARPKAQARPRARARSSVRTTAASAVAQRRVKFYLAASLDGYIARTDGRVDWLDPFTGDYGYQAFYAGIDTVVMGRKTWEQALTFESHPFKSKTCYVFSRTYSGTEHGAHMVRGDVAAFVKTLRSEPGQDIWLVGGGELARDFFTAGLVDDLIITWVPIVLGSGIPMFPPGGKESHLRLVGCAPIEDGLVQSHYRIPVDPA